MAKHWTRDQLLVVLGLYCEMPFGQFHSRNARIIDVAAEIQRTPDALAMKLSNLASLDPVITGSGRRGLSGASAADRAIWQEFSDHPDALMPAIESALARVCSPMESVAPEDESPSYHADDRMAMTKQRTGQGLFRKAILSAYNFQCCLTGLREEKLLVASHILPWAKSKKDRLNPRNGLCLSVLYDRAFDAGLITLSKSHKLMVSPQLHRQQENTYVVDSFIAKEGQAINLPDKFSPDDRFMQWHREQWFRK